MLVNPTYFRLTLEQILELEGVAIEAGVLFCAVGKEVLGRVRMLQK